MSTLTINNEKYDTALLATWIKYERLHQELSQEFLAHGICSISHLSYFENGKRNLNDEVVTALIKKLGFVNISIPADLGILRTLFYSMFQQITLLDYDAAKITYEQFIQNEALIIKSPYHVEYKIFELVYMAFVENKTLSELKEKVTSLEKICDLLSEELKHILLFVTSRLYYKFGSPLKGINIMRTSQDIKRTAYTDYHLGFMYGFENQPLKGVYHLEKALKSYENSGYYLNAMWSNNYLGIFSNRLGDQHRALKHYTSALNAANYFGIDEIKNHLYINLAHQYGESGDHEQSIVYCDLAIEMDRDPILAVNNKLSALIKLGRDDQLKVLFDCYLKQEYENSKYYKLLKFSYLQTFHFDTPEFESEILNDILPYYKGLHYVEIMKKIQLGLIDYYESNRQYKKANTLYKQILSM